MLNYHRTLSLLRLLIQSYIELPQDTLVVELPGDTVFVELPPDTITVVEYVQITDTLEIEVIEYIYLTDTIVEVQFIDCNTGLPCEDPPGGPRRR